MATRATSSPLDGFPMAVSSSASSCWDSQPLHRGFGGQAEPCVNTAGFGQSRTLHPNKEPLFSSTSARRLRQSHFRWNRTPSAPCTPPFPGPSASRKPGLRKQFTSSQCEIARLAVLSCSSMWVPVTFDRMPGAWWDALREQTLFCSSSAFRVYAWT